MIAIDVVLLPPPGIMDKVIKLNHELVEKGNSDIILNIPECMPHITVAMGCIEEDTIENINVILGDISGRFSPIDLETVPSENGKASMEIRKSDRILALHEEIMDRLSGLCSYEVTEDMICRKDGEAISDTTLRYIRWFEARSSFGNYAPHITINKGNMNGEIGYYKFVSDQLALCHLGNFCTCRKMLLSHNMTGPV